jgi:hypothetical protein
MAGVSGHRVSLRGILYCGKKFTGAANPANTQVIHGSLILSNAAALKGHLEIFYEDSWPLRTAAQEIHTEGWRELPDALP